MTESAKLHYLGPEGSFTHAAALEFAKDFEGKLSRSLQLTPQGSASEVFEAVSGSDDFGILAFESNVEGYVVPNLDALIDADDVVGIDRVGVPVAFDAFVLPGHGELTEVSAHPHGLAQCQGFIEKGKYQQIPATSNAAACKNLGPHQIGLGPRICGELYHLETFGSQVQDYQGARTEFLLLSSRSAARRYLQVQRSRQAEALGKDSNALDSAGSVYRHFETVVAFVPLSTGPGVLANALETMRDAGLNMTSFISRPIKGNDGTYSFIATLDSAPWEGRFVSAFTSLLDQGDWVRTLAVYNHAEHVSPPVETWMLPAGGVRSAQDPAAAREILWGSGSLHTNSVHGTEGEAA